MALSPDGQTLAFGCCDAPGILFDLSEGPKIFDPSAYGINVEKLFIPAWSPDGRKLAWMVRSSGQLGVAIFDLETKTHQFLHPYTPLGGSEFAFDLAWSPDNEWLAFTTTAETAELGRAPGLWVIRTDGKEEFFLGVGFGPVWSPNGERLAFNRLGESGLDRMAFIVEVGKWDQPTLLPFTAEVKGWILKD